MFPTRLHRGVSSLGAGAGELFGLCSWNSDPSDQLELTIQMGIQSFVSCSRSSQDDLICSVQAVEAVCWVKVRMLLSSFFVL